ncbi:MAG: hypothetical protein II750_06165 [Bacteroidaceae bacterium]|nr:hypothetical protein [Bacteroidaceae bacterium]
MRKTWIYIVSAAMLSTSLLTSCDFTSSRNYMGTMAGAEIGGVIGEALGWMSTDRHDGPGKAMLGSVIGTVAGAAIGNVLTKDREEHVVASSRRDDSRRDDIYRSDTQANGGYQTGGGYQTDGGYQTNGGYQTGSDYNTRNYTSLSIAGVTYQDEDGDGRFSRNETVNIIYEVTNHSSVAANVELKVETLSDSKNFVLSPANTVKIGPHETIRYKAKAFCKSRTSSGSVKFRLLASSSTAGNASAELQIRMSK